MSFKVLLSHPLKEEAFPKSSVWVICTMLTSILGITYHINFFYISVSPNKPWELGEQPWFLCPMCLLTRTLPHIQLSNQKPFTPPSFHHSQHALKHHVGFIKNSTSETLLYCAHFSLSPLSLIKVPTISHLNSFLGTTSVFISLFKKYLLSTNNVSTKSAMAWRPTCVHNTAPFFMKLSLVGESDQ